jgi:iron complex outermembrane receptor protein
MGLKRSNLFAFDHQSLQFADFKLYIGYTLIDAHLNENGVIRENPLTAKHRLNNVVMYEKEDKGKIGFEAYY